MEKVTRKEIVEAVANKILEGLFAQPRPVAKATPEKPKKGRAKKVGGAIAPIEEAMAWLQEHPGASASQAGPAIANALKNARAQGLVRVEGRARGMRYFPLESSAN